MKKFHSAMVILPGSSQFKASVITQLLYLIFQVLCFASSLSDFDVLMIIEIPVLTALILWHTIVFHREAVRDVTSFLPTLLYICGAMILFRILHTVFSFSVSSLLLTLAEAAFWIGFGFCSVKAVCGKYKLIVPMIFLFFGFFFAFIQTDLHFLPSIAAQICFLLLLWYPIDAVVFTSVIDKIK